MASPIFIWVQLQEVYSSETGIFVTELDGLLAQDADTRSARLAAWDEKRVPMSPPSPTAGIVGETSGAIWMPPPKPGNLDVKSAYVLVIGDSACAVNGAKGEYDIEHTHEDPRLEESGL